MTAREPQAPGGRGSDQARPQCAGLPGDRKTLGRHPAGSEMLEVGDQQAARDPVSPVKARPVVHDQLRHRKPVRGQIGPDCSPASGSGVDVEWL